MSIDDLLQSTGAPARPMVKTPPAGGAVVVALRTRPFLPTELEQAGETEPERGVEVEGGKDMVVKVQVKKVSLLTGLERRG